MLKQLYITSKGEVHESLLQNLSGSSYRERTQQNISKKELAAMLSIAYREYCITCVPETLESYIAKSLLTQNSLLNTQSKVRI